MQRVIVVVGPTASGKSALAVRLAKRLKGEIISADSRQVYTGLDIGTGKVTKKEMAGIKHHLLDVASPRKVFTAADFVRLGRKAISDIHKRGKAAIICGGTGFYIDALLGRVELANAKPNKKLRASLAKKSVGDLFKILQRKNPDKAKAMNTSDRQNPVRLIRALEILAKNKPHFEQGDTLIIPAVWIGIDRPKEDLRARIHKRLITRMKIGMLSEARRLHKNGLSWKRMEELGLEYRYMALHLQDKISKEEMLTQLEAKIWQYAKRQMTYWKRNKEIRWFENADKAFSSLDGGR